MTSPIRRRPWKYAVCALISAAIIAVPLIASAGAASGAQRMVLRTSVTAISSSGQATVTATVRFVLLAPSGGRVTFYDATNHRSLGSAPLRAKSGGACATPARVCVAKLSVFGHQLAPGINHIIGRFDPQRLYYPRFQGRTFLYRGVSPKCHSVSPASLPVFTGGPIVFAGRSRGALCRGRVRDPQGNTAVTVSSTQRATVTHNTVVAFGSQTLPCTTRGSGDLMAYSISTRAPGDMALQVSGHPATVAHNAHPKGYLCYESTIPFRTASGSRAKRAGGFYYGSLPHCRDNDGDDIYPVRANGDDQRLHAAPCIEWEQYSVKHGLATWQTWFEPTTGDPRISR